jgi:hypothetical protein
MIFVLLAISALFVAIGFSVTENNAKYLLSGYNTMTEQDRKNVDIKAYIPYFRNFHIFLGISFLMLGAALTYLISENAGGIFLGVYPVLAYMYFVATSSTYLKGAGRRGNKVAFGILGVILLSIIALFGFGFREDRLTFHSNGVTLGGMYGETLPASEIQSIELVNELPEITFKSNGFALGTIHKGYFKTNREETVKLIMNSDKVPVILLTKSNGERVYYTAKNRTSDEIVKEMKQTLPNVIYK